MSIFKLRKNLLKNKISKESTNICIKLLGVSRHSYKSEEGIIDLGIFMEPTGIVTPVIDSNEIKLYGKNEKGLADIFVSVKEPIDPCSKGYTTVDQGKTTTAIFTEEGSIYSITGYPRRFYLFSPEIRYYSKEKVISYFCNKKPSSVFDIISDEEINPTVKFNCNCRRIGYEKAFDEKQISMFMYYDPKGFRKRK